MGRIVPHAESNILKNISYFWNIIVLLFLHLSHILVLQLVEVEHTWTTL